jgi:hypothetical protein
MLSRGVSTNRQAMLNSSVIISQKLKNGPGRIRTFGQWIMSPIHAL